MREQTRRRQRDLVAQFPVLGRIIAEENDRNHNPEVPMRIYICVQMADVDFVNRRTAHTSPSRDRFIEGDLFNEPSLRGTLREHVVAVAPNHTYARVIYWHSEQDTYPVKIIFDGLEKEVEYLVLVQRYNWRTVTQDELEGIDQFTSPWAIPKKRTLVLTVYQKPGIGFPRLLEAAATQ